MNWLNELLTLLNGLSPSAGALVALALILGIIAVLKIR
jgi:hypothetical protein